MVIQYKTENGFGSGEVRSWASIIDDATLTQAQMISRSPIIDDYLVLMPDAHFGFGPPVGSALKTKEAVMPYAVGVDIGCGMIAVKTNHERRKFLGKEREILGQIRENIPSGLGRWRSETIPQATTFLEKFGLPPGIEKLRDPEVQDEHIRHQFGTLGSGNHFVEVCEDTEGIVWLLLHSGSRGIGNTLATYHFNQAKTFCVAEDLPLEHQELAYLPCGTKMCVDYIGDMLWAQEYAFHQREAMMSRLVDVIVSVVGFTSVIEKINCHHNYATALDNEGTRWLTRKGAINASLGKFGIIPGSMGAATYIVRGKGNQEAYETSPHGAGRQMGRNQARKNLSISEFEAQMKGRTWQDRDANDLLDEAPSAYKPIETVMEDSRDLVDVITILSQFINYKGVESSRRK